MRLVKKVMRWFVILIYSIVVSWILVEICRLFPPYGSVRYYFEQNGFFQLMRQCGKLAVLAGGIVGATTLRMWVQEKLR